jgi:DNA invertase Pin-like site-specific DNA recombinase
MIYAYIRVSTDKQTTENQRFEIERFCQLQNIVIERWIEETISATKDLEKRKLGRLLKHLRAGDMVIASEISRLGRKLLEIMSILHYCMKNGAAIWTIKDNFRLDAGIQSKVLAFAFGLSAEIERNLISQRTKEALAARRAAGVILGRPIGAKSTIIKLTGKDEIIKKWLCAGISKTQVAHRLKIHRKTLYRWLNNYKENGL